MWWLLAGIAALNALGGPRSEERKASADSKGGSDSDMQTYRSADGASFFRFDFTRMRDGTLRIYILDHPAYGSRPDGPQATHRRWDDTGPFICWTDPIRTEDEAKAVSRAWAENTLIYQRTGRTF